MVARRFLQLVESRAQWLQWAKYESLRGQKVLYLALFEEQQTCFGRACWGPFFQFLDAAPSSESSTEFARPVAKCQEMITGIRTLLERKNRGTIVTTSTRYAEQAAVHPSAAEN